MYVRKYINININVYVFLSSYVFFDYHQKRIGTLYTKFSFRTYMIQKKDIYMSRFHFKVNRILL